MCRVCSTAAPVKNPVPRLQKVWGLGFVFEVLEFGVWSSEFRVEGLWFVVNGVMRMVHGVRCMVYSVWCMVCGVWCMHDYLELRVYSV